MKTTKIASAMLAALLLAGCSSTTADSATESTSPPAAPASEEPPLTAEGVVETLENDGRCSTAYDVKETDENPNSGTGCIYFMDGRHQVTVVGQANSEEEAKAFAEEAFRTGAALRIDTGEMNTNDWNYSFDSGLVMTGSEDIISEFFTGSYSTVYTEDDVVRPAVGLQLSNLKYDTRKWHGRCQGPYGAVKNLYDEPAYGDLYDQCVTGNPLTEINTFRGWWQMSPYLEEQKDMITAPSSGPFYAIIGDYWSVFDNTADKKEITELQKVIGGEVVDLKTFDPGKFEQDLSTTK